MKRKLALSLMSMVASASLMAGGLNTNTNQSAEYLRNPARDGAIGIDGVYSNPAGVAFLDSGLHVSLNIQSAFQERNITSTNKAFKYGVKNDGETKTFEGKATAPIVPSLQAAYNWNNWSFQLNVAVTGGGGKCEFEKGLGSFESNVASLPEKLEALKAFGRGVDGYDADCYMKGRSYYIGITLGAARKLNENLSAYLGVRGLYGNCSYKGHLKNIQVRDMDGMHNASNYLNGIASELDSMKMPQAQAAAGMLRGAAKSTEDIVLDCDQYGWGFAPIIGLDWKYEGLNLSARYEFRTAMKLENDAVNSETANMVPALAKYKDGETVREDAPALLTLGAQYEICPKLRVMGGYHLFFDKQSKQYGDRQDLLDKNTQEMLFGAEYDICEHLQFSVGTNRTWIFNTDEYIQDVSYNVNSWNLGTGFGIMFTKDLKVNLAYYHSFYEGYTRTTETGKDEFERKNNSFGIGVNYRF